MQNTMTETENIKNIVKERNLQHIAIIMDGNRRWAKKKMLPSAAGHKKGVEALRSTLKACAKFDVKYLTVYAFSTENWKRDKEEVEFLMDLLAHTIKNELDELHENGVVINFIGDLTKLNSKLQEILEMVRKENMNIDFNRLTNKIGDKRRFLKKLKEREELEYE